MAEYTVVREGGHYRVIDQSGRHMSGLVNIKALAEIKAEELARKVKGKRRVCLAHGCHATFVSEGPHHRLCNFHRAYGSDAGVFFSTGSQRRVRFRSS